MMTKEKLHAKTFDPHQAIKSGAALQQWRKQIKISQPVYAALSACSTRTLATLESKPRLSMQKQRKINETRRLLAGLCEIMEPANVSRWLQTPNEWFDGHTPMEAVNEGKIDKVWELIYHTKDGGYL